MPRIHDAREDHTLVKVLRWVGFLLAVTFCFVFLREGAHLLSDPTSALARYREPAAPPHVFVRGNVLRRDGGGSGVSAPRALCTVVHEHYQSCGKSYCWVGVEDFRYSNAFVDIGWSSAPLPPRMELSDGFQFEPWRPAPEIVDSTLEWRKCAQKNGHGFADASFKDSKSDRIVERCSDGTVPSFIEACISPTDPRLLEPCPGQTRYGVIPNGEPEAARDDAADDIARYLGAAALALFVAMLVWLRSPRAIVAGLEDRAAPHRRSLGWLWALLAIVPILVFGVVLMHASRPPSTWSTGRGGFTFAISMLVVWLVFAIHRWIHRSRLVHALAPILATPRSLLAQASATVELAVRARGNSLRSFIGDEAIAFSEIRITETVRKGRNTSTAEVFRGRLRDRLDVVDESGDGVLDLSNGILDVEQRTMTMPTLSPRYYENGVNVLPSANHVSFTIRESVIRDEEPLYVFGDVSGIALHATEGGYRSVQGSPTLGGKDAAPVLVHAGDERGLVARLSAEARTANSFAVVAACVCTVLSAAIVALSRL